MMLIKNTKDKTNNIKIKPHTKEQRNKRAHDSLKKTSTINW
jgi:hypothetical protein